MSADTVPLVDFAPALRLLALALLLAAMPLAWLWLRQRSADAPRRLAALTALTLFLTFDLIVFGAFTRLTDSGLGCPDWPGCYGEVSPLGARAEIRAAEAAAPGGPVTWHKAWIEMIHRYLAMTVGVLILVMAAFAWREHLRRPMHEDMHEPVHEPMHEPVHDPTHEPVQPHPRRAAPRDGTAAPRSATLPISPWWPTATLVWVIVQGLFGKYTVTLKLFPAVVTLHLLGGLVLLAMLAVQHSAFLRRPLPLTRGLRGGAFAVALVLALQVALGGWVSTNYAVLACTGFPQCNGQWWPPMDFATGFTLLRALGGSERGGVVSLEALVAIHWAHRVGALATTAAVLALAWALWRAGRGAPAHSASAAAAAGREGAATLQRFGLGLALLVLAQVMSGLSNVVLGWPIVAALAHSAGAAALALLLALLLARSARGGHGAATAATGLLRPGPGRLRA